MRRTLLRAAGWLPFALAAAVLHAPLLQAQTSGLPAPGVPLAGASPLAMDTAGLLGLYTFNETDGNLLDVSGNGNTGAVGAAPVRSGSSYQFTSAGQSVDFPAALNAANTFYLVVTAPPIAGGQGDYDNNRLLAFLSSNSTGGAGLRINGYSVQAGPLAPFNNEFLNEGSSVLSWAPANANFAATNATGDVWAGTHVVALSCPSGAPGQFYLDGVALANASGSASCSGLQTNGNFRLGTSTQSAFWPFGSSYWAAAFYSSADSPAQVLKRSLALKNYAVSKGAPFAGSQPTVAQTGAKVISAGDSITCGYGPDPKCATRSGGPGTNSYPNLATGSYNKSYTAVNLGVPFSYVQDNLAAAPVLIDPLCTNSDFGQNTVTLQGGTNNLNLPSSSVNLLWSMQTAFLRGRQQAGCRTVLMGLIARGGASCLGGQNCDAVVQQVDAVQRAEWKNAGAAAYVDFGSDPILGATGAAANATYYFDASGAQLHPNLAGEQRMAAGLACVMNGLDGSNANSMNPAAITAASTTLGCGDGGRYLDPTANAVTVTLPSAMWQTGREIAYCNVSSSTANAATLTAPSDFPFSNVSGRTTLTVAPNSCVRLRAMFNGNVTAPGNYWMQQ